MKTHPELGANLLGHFESYREIAAVILAHQEHFDGTGYPRGLKAKEIPLFARIIANCGRVPCHDEQPTVSQGPARPAKR